MALHRLTTLSLGVPDPAATAAFYRDFGLVETAPGLLATREGGDQLRLSPAPKRRLLSVGVGAGNPDDLARIEGRVRSLGLEPRREDGRLVVHDPGSDVAVEVSVAPAIAPAPPAEARINAPGTALRRNARADAFSRTDPVRPRKLGHVVFTSLDFASSRRLFVEGLGFEVSDELPGIGAFLRCSTDHHNVFLQEAPIRFLHHAAWEVDDVDEIGRGGHAMVAADPSRHVWGFGRHYVGSNFFWYLRDPAGNFAEYYSDLDVIDDAAAWRPGKVEGMLGLYAWGPPVPPEFIAPPDVVG